jgi:hypothetical protein
MPVYTLADLRALALRRLDENSEFYDQESVDQEINDAIRAWNAFTGRIVDSKLVPGGTVSGQVLYRVPSGILFPIRVSVGGLELKKSSMSDIGHLRRRWPADRSDGKPSFWIPVGIDRFALWRVPAVGAVPISVFGVAEPTALSQSTDAISLPDEDVAAIIEAAVASLVFREGGPALRAAVPMYQRYLAAIKERGRFKKVKLPRYWLIEKEEGDASR